ncbi:MAG TPA: urea carboxylase-associated family protein [Stellaceae bacterium]|nr:urea carboxylase-associated family protein [Stellaceae bacterium]
MAHSHAELSKTLPTTGDTMVSNRRRSMLTFIEDTSSGIHDTVIAACDRYRYERLGVVGHHDNCTDNLRAALAELGLEPPLIPPPLNLFMNIPIAADGTVSFQPSVAGPGSHVALRAERDLIIVFSACPQDIVPINGADCVPKDAHFEIVS